MPNQRREETTQLLNFVQNNEFGYLYYALRFLCTKLPLGRELETAETLESIRVWIYHQYNVGEGENQLPYVIIRDDMYNPAKYTFTIHKTLGIIYNFYFIDADITPFLLEYPNDDDYYFFPNNPDYYLYTTLRKRYVKYCEENDIEFLETFIRLYYYLKFPQNVQDYDTAISLIENAPSFGNGEIDSLFPERYTLGQRIDILLYTQDNDNFCFVAASINDDEESLLNIYLEDNEISDYEISDYESSDDEIGDDEIESSCFSDSSSETDEKCSICLEDNIEETLRLTNCKHTFHIKCFVRWYKENQTCPYCRQNPKT